MLTSVDTRSERQNNRTNRSRDEARGISRLTGDGFWGMAPGAVLVPGASSIGAEEVGVTSSFESVLFDQPGTGSPSATPEPPDYVADLHLADIVTSITTGRADYDLASFYLTPLRQVSTIGYRHAVFRDLEDEGVAAVIRSFAGRMRRVRNRLTRASNVHYRHEQERWFLDAADDYADAIAEASKGLSSLEVRSSGLTGFRDHLARYVASDAFSALVADTQRMKARLATVRYRLRLHGPKVTVTPFEPEPDYGAEVLAHFEKFRQGAGREYEFDIDRLPNMNHVEAAILEGVARQQPEVFAALDAYCRDHAAFIDPTVARFEREIQFYIAYQEHIGSLRQAGLPFCYPDVGAIGDVECRGLFDLALAGKLVDEGKPVIANDLDLCDPERIIVVSGPNQGGKTTFARAIGQLHHLARIGVPVPGTSAHLPLVDRIYTHFERQEQVEDLSSKLEDDLRRIHAILEAASADSLLIMNESFSSTTVTDQLFIGRQVIRQIIERGVVCVVVTFLDELASLDPTIASMVSTVDPDEPARRTFRILRRPADGLAYALAIAEKHRLTYPGVKARLGR